MARGQAASHSRARTMTDSWKAGMQHRKMATTSEVDSLERAMYSRNLRSCPASEKPFRQLCSRPPRATHAARRAGREAPRRRWRGVWEPFSRAAAAAATALERASAAAAAAVGAEAPPPPSRCSGVLLLCSSSNPRCCCMAGSAATAAAAAGRRSSMEARGVAGGSRPARPPGPLLLCSMRRQADTSPPIVNMPCRTWSAVCLQPLSVAKARSATADSIIRARCWGCIASPRTASRRLSTLPPTPPAGDTIRPRTSAAAPPAAAAAAAEVGAAADNGKGGPLGGAGDSPSNGVKAAGGEAGVVEAPAQGSEGGAALAAVSAAPCSPPWTASARVPAALADERPAVTEYAPPSTTTNTTSPPPPPAAHASGGVASSALQAAAALSPAQTTGRVAGGAGGAGVGASPPPPPPQSSPSPRVSTDMSRGALAATHCAAGLPPPPSHGVLDSLLRGVQSAMSLVDGNGWTRRHLRSAMGDQALEAVGAAASASGGKEVQLLVTHPLQLISSYAQVAGSEPPFTSSHDCFHNTCDYIFFTPAPSGVAAPAAAAGLSASASAPGQPRQPAQPQLVPLSVLAVPPASAVPGGMPAAQWGSDHIALITTFELRTSQQL